MPKAHAQGSQPITQLQKQEAERFFSDAKIARTYALLVYHNGQIVYERYASGVNATTPMISWSMAKSVTSTLIGILVDEGKLNLDAPAPVAAWQRPGDPRRAITLRHLLNMASGLRERSAAGANFASDTTRLAFGDGAQDVARFSANTPLTAKPGTRFTYSTLTTMLLSDIATRAVTTEENPTKRRAQMRAWMDAKLFKPAGMTGMVPEFDAKGTFLGGAFFYGTPYDWLAFGKLYLNGGRVGSTQIVPKAWLDYVRTSSAAEPAYSGQFWLNQRRAPGRRPALFPEQGPSDLYGAIGHLGQYVLVVPSRDLVIVRLGNTEEPKLDNVRAQLARLVNAWPDTTPVMDRRS
jgi:CubicO group peptidase (beta-lactamase class C family)